VTRNVEQEVEEWRASIRTEAQREMLEVITDAINLEIGNNKYSSETNKVLEKVRNEFQTSHGLLAKLSPPEGVKLITEGVQSRKCHMLLCANHGELFLYPDTGGAPFLKMTGLDFSHIPMESWASIAKVDIKIHKRAATIKVIEK